MRAALAGHRRLVLVSARRHGDGRGHHRRGRAFRCRGCMAAAGLSAGDPTLIARDRLVLWSIRLPRIALACMIGALLAAAGAVMQGLFRNPLADPGAGRRVQRRRARRRLHHRGRRPLLAGTEIAACRSRRCRSPRSSARSSTTAVLYRIATREGRTSIATVPARRPRDRGAGAMPASGCWSSSPTTASCATSRSGCSARSAARPGRRSARSRRSSLALLLVAAVHRARARPDGAGRGGSVPHAGVAVERLKRVCDRAGRRRRPAPRSRSPASSASSASSCRICCGS